MRLLRPILPLLAVCVLVAAACSSGDTAAEESGAATDGEPQTRSESATETATGADEASSGSAAGDLLEAVEERTSGYKAWTISYLSTGVDGGLVEVSGRVLAPEDGGAGAHVISWTHGTTGVGDRCAPSANPNLISPAPQRLAEAGFVVAVTDYEGLGSDGIHPYLVGESEAHSAIDIVRAVEQLQLGTSDKWAVAGLSQGGHAALWTGQLSAGYAPELELVGVVAAAPAANITNLMRSVGTAAQGFAIQTAYVMADVYDDVHLDAYFTAEAIEAMAVVETGCNADVFATFLNQTYEDLVVPEGWDDVTPLGPLAERLAENEAGQVDIDVPVLFVQGDIDVIVAREQVEALHGVYCAMATNAEYNLYIGGGHGDTILTALDDTIVWLEARFAGTDPGDLCAIVDPDLEALRAAELTAPAVDGTLLAGSTPEGYDTLTSESNAPRRETCPGTPIFGGRTPLAYSSSVWGAKAITGPFLDVFVARFASADEAAAALAAFDAELIDCGRFIDPATTAEGEFSRGDDPDLGHSSFESVFRGGLSGIPINRVGYVVQVGETVYSAAQTVAFADAEPAIPREAIEVMLES